MNTVLHECRFWFPDDIHFWTKSLWLWNHILQVWSCLLIEGMWVFARLELPWDHPGVDCLDYLDWKESHKSLMNQRPWSKFDPIVFSLFRKILQPLPSRRYKICQIKEHPWVKKTKLRALGELSQLNDLMVWLCFISRHHGCGCTWDQVPFYPWRTSYAFHGW